MRVEFTLAEFIDNIEKNGLPQTKGYFFTDSNKGVVNNPHYLDAESYLREKSTIVSACAVGQAAINLSVNPIEMAWKESYPWTDDFYAFHQVRATIEDWNDTPEGEPPRSYKDIAYDARERFKNILDRVIVADSFDYRPYMFPKG